VVGNLSDVLGVVDKAVREIHTSTPDHPEEPKDGIIVVGRVDWNVLVLTDDDLREPVGGGAYGLPPDVALQSAPLALRATSAAFEAPIVSGNETRLEEWLTVCWVGFLRVRESKFSNIDIADVRGSRERVKTVVRLLMPYPLKGTTSVSDCKSISSSAPEGGAFSAFENPLSFPAGRQYPLPVPPTSEKSNSPCPIWSRSRPRSRSPEAE